MSKTKYQIYIDPTGPKDYLLPPDYISFPPSWSAEERAALRESIKGLGLTKSLKNDHPFYEQPIIYCPYIPILKKPNSMNKPKNILQAILCFFGFHKWEECGVGTMAVVCSHCDKLHINR